MQSQKGQAAYPRDKAGKQQKVAGVLLGRSIRSELAEWLFSVPGGWLVGGHTAVCVLLKAQVSMLSRDLLHLPAGEKAVGPAGLAAISLMPPI